MFRVPLFIALLLLVAFGGATASAIYALRATAGFGSIDIGPWKAWPLAQTEEADPYAKAHRALDGKLLLGKAEGLIFVATADSTGDPLVSNCHYLLTGKTPQTRLWTLHATDGFDDPMPVEAGLPAALASHMVQKDGTGAFTIHVSSQPSPGNWLATAGPGRPFKLILSLFDTPTASSSRLINLQMPEIIKIGCGDV